MTAAARQIAPIELKGPFDFLDSPLSKAAEQPMMLGVFLNLQDIGIDGIQLSFYDFGPDLAYFGERILPLMRQAGLRL